MEQKFHTYLKHESSFNLLIFSLGIVCILIAAVLAFLGDLRSVGLSYSLIPLGAIASFYSWIEYRRLIKIKRKSDSEGQELKEMMGIEKDRISQFLELQSKNITLYSGMLLLGIILGLLCVFALDNSMLAGVAAGISIVSTILLIQQIISGFRKKMFLHETRNY